MSMNDLVRVLGDYGQFNTPTHCTQKWYGRGPLEWSRIAPSPGQFDCQKPDSFIPKMKDETVYQSLLSMGFDQDQANRASEKFDNPELAINWVLEGAVVSLSSDVTSHRRSFFLSLPLPVSSSLISVTLGYSYTPLLL